MLSAAFTDAFPPPPSVAGAPGPLASVKREPCSDDEEIEVGKETEAMEDDSRPVPVQDMPEDLSVKKKGSNDISASTSRSSSISPPSRSSESGSPDSQKNGDQSRAKRIKPIPPPLDLNARTLSPSDTLPGPPGHAHPLSPAHSADTPRESLPLRKRQLDIKQELGLRPAPPSAPPLTLPSTISVTPSSGPSSAHHPASFTHFPVPPLIPVPPGLSAAYPKSPFLPNGFATPPSDLHSPGYPWTALGMFPPFSPLAHSPLPFPPSSLLSPAPSSYHSSSNSSREDLPAAKVISAPKPRYGIVPSLVPHSQQGADSGVSSSSPAPSSPLLSPHTWSHSWPTPAWQCFEPGVSVKFLLPNTDTPWQKVEELGWKDKIALKVDSRNPYRYAPNGLTVIKVDVISREEAGDGSPGAGHGQVLRLRMSPHNVAEVSRVEMLADCPIDHPFFVKDKGWCSAYPRLSLEKYGIPCQDISPADVCLPPNHPEAVRTPDLCDRFKKFEFSSQDLCDQFSPGARPRPDSGLQLRHGIASLLPSVRASTASGSMMSPPMSPAKKTGKDPDKPKRPMNGFMLFAKKYRLELIQQHPGKDNRAISVLLGEAWKNLQTEEREVFSQKAKIMADEQKKLHPDCWKRKRSLSSANSHSSGSASAAPAPSPHTPSRLAHPFTFLTAHAQTGGAGLVGVTHTAHPVTSIFQGLTPVAGPVVSLEHASNR